MELTLKVKEMLEGKIITRFSDIAEAVGCSRQLVSRIAKEMGVSPQYDGDRKRAREYIESKEGNISPHEVARETGCTVYMAKDELREAKYRAMLKEEMRKAAAGRVPMFGVD